jgi:hypothetical protein
MAAPVSSNRPSVLRRISRRQSNDLACYCGSVFVASDGPMGPVPTAAKESSAMRRAITIECDSAGFESFSDESLRCLVCKALTSLLHRKPIQSAMRIQKLRELAKARGGDCLSTIYLGRKAKLEWVCKEGHTWEAMPDSILRGTWCPVCANVQRIIKQRSGSLLSPEDWLEILRRHARSKGGELLSSSYTNAKTRLRWRCKLNHEWLAMPTWVRQGAWCPYCARGSKQTRAELAEIPCRCAQSVIGHAQEI